MRTSGSTGFSRLERLTALAAEHSVPVLAIMKCAGPMTSQHIVRMLQRGMKLANHMRPLTIAVLAPVALLTTAGLLTFGGFRDEFSEETQKARRLHMVERQIKERGITDKAVLAAMAKVPRHRFVPSVWQGSAYSDGPLSIGEGQTISQPYIVAWMTELIKPAKAKRVLEIGTGSGYQAAVLAECVGEVDSIEVVTSLGQKAETRLRELGYRNVRLRIGDGYEGWADRAPYDAILLTAAPPHHVPRPLLDQLKVGGRLVAPVGREFQRMVVFTRTETGFKKDVLAPVMFVPMTGKAQNDH
jgi:protein-L-isoaspartate(D-aspartate) O-methyltransferase